MNICVFCASSQDVGEPYVSACRTLGLEIGRRGHTLVFGGYDTGLMGVFAHAVRDGGGRVIGVYPDDVSGFKKRVVFDADEIYRVPNITERKSRMEELADAFITAPGSFGTFDELYDVLVELKIGDRSKSPVLIYNIDGYFDLFETGCRQMIDRGFMPTDDLSLFEICSDPIHIVDRIERISADL